MMNANTCFVELNEAELEAVVGGKTWIEAVTGDTYVRTGPSLNHCILGVLKKGDDARYQDKSATDGRGVVWYKVKWNGRSGWVSSRYTRRIKY